MARMLTCFANLILFAVSPAAQAKDPEAMFNTHCRQCHTAKKGDNRLGPSLYGVVGRKAGAVEGFPYSDSLKTSGVIWDEATLDKWIANPDAVVAGHGMKPYTGIADANIRSAIIEFLKSRAE
jgi:cytochrome c